MKTTELPPANNPVKIVLWILVSLSTFFFGLFGRTANVLLDKLSTTNAPKELLIAGLLLSLATIPLLVGLLILAWNENRTLKMQPQWFPAFGAQWRYHPGERRFDLAPYCACCPTAPKQLSYRGMHPDLHVEWLRCPIEKADWFVLTDTSSGKEVHLTRQQALDKLKQEVLHAT